jgi:hypothetical protein
MENRQQNATFETLANLARLGSRPGDWKATPISETQAARDTDPLRSEGRLADGWWKKAEPRDSSGRALIQLLDRAARKFAKDDKESRTVRKYARDSATSRVQEYLPNSGQSLGEWLSQLMVRIDVTSGYRSILFGGLKSFLERFSGRSLWRDLGAPDQKAVRAIVEKLCEA